MNMENLQKKPWYNPEIDIWKLLFAVSIFLFHSHKFEVTTGLSIFRKGYLGVEFFFMVSGYFMAQKIRDGERYGRTESAGSFLLHKVRKIYPVYLAAFIIAFIGRLTILRVDRMTVLRSIVQAASEALMLQMYGIPMGREYNGPTWYISAMLIAMALLWPIARRWKDYFFTVGAPVLALTGYAVLAQQTGGGLNIAETWWVVIYLGTIRALAGLSVGVFCNECCEWIRQRQLETTRTGKRVFLAAELLLIFLIVCILNFATPLKLNYTFDYAAVFLIFALLLIVFSELTGLKDKIKSPERIALLGKLSLYLFLNHRVVIFWLQGLGVQWSYRHYMFWYVIGTMGTTTACWMLVKAAGTLWRGTGHRITACLFVKKEVQESDGEV